MSALQTLVMLGEGFHPVPPNLSSLSDCPSFVASSSTLQGPGTQQACLRDQQGSLRWLQALWALCHGLRVQRGLQPLLQAAPRSQIRGRRNNDFAPESRFFVTPCSSNTEVHRRMRIACFLHDALSGCATPSRAQVESNERTVLRNVFICNKTLVWYFDFMNSFSSGKCQDSKVIVGLTECWWLCWSSVDCWVEV